MAKRQKSGGAGLRRREAISLLGAAALGIGSILGEVGPASQAAQHQYVPMREKQLDIRQWCHSWTMAEMAAFTSVGLRAIR